MMNIKEILNEMPYLHHGEMNRTLLDISYSADTLKREFSKIGKINDIYVLIAKENSHVIGINESNSSSILSRIQPVFYIAFKNSDLLNFKHELKNILQIDKVVINRAKGNIGIISKVYNMLVDSGFTIVSDITQYDPAKSLWKKIARETKYLVYVADVDYGFFRDNDGTIIRYNGFNVPDYDIWSEGSNFDGQYRVLILTK